MAWNMQSSGPWVTYVGGTENPRLRVFCFPNAGAGVNSLRSWMGGLPQDISLGLVHLPGRESRFLESPFVEMESLVRALAEHLKDELTGSFAFFGHSMGASVAFELARALDGYGRVSPKALFASGRRAPQCPSRFPELHGLDDKAFIQEMREMGGTPDEIFRSPELLELVLPSLRADVELTETYVYRSGSRLACPIIAYGGYEDQYVNLEELNGWKDQTTGPFRARRFPGGHFFVNDSRDEFLAAFAADLTTCDTTV